MQKIGIWKGKGHDRRGGTPRKVQVLAPVAGSADDVMFSLFFALHDELPTVGGPTCGGEGTLGAANHSINP